MHTSYNSQQVPEFMREFSSIPVLHEFNYFVEVLKSKNFVNFLAPYRAHHNVNYMGIANPYAAHDLFEYLAAHECDGPNFKDMVRPEIEVFFQWLNYLNEYLFITEQSVSLTLLNWLEKNVYDVNLYPESSLYAIQCFPAYQLSTETLDMLIQYKACAYHEVLSQRNLIIKNIEIINDASNTPYPHYIPRGDKRVSLLILKAEAKLFEALLGSQDKLANLLASKFNKIPPLDNPCLSMPAFKALLDMYLTRFRMETQRKYLFTQNQAELILDLLKNEYVNHEVPNYLISSLTSDLTLPYELRKEILALRPGFDYFAFLPDDPYTGLYFLFEPKKHSSWQGIHSRVMLLQEKWMLKDVIDVIATTDEPSNILSGIFLNPYMTHELYWKLFQIEGLSDKIKLGKLVKPGTIKNLDHLFVKSFVDPYQVNAFTLTLEYNALWNVYTESQKTIFKNKVRKYGLTTTEYGFFQQELPLELWIEIISNHLLSPIYPIR
jgi:hypothetical protein